MKNIKREILTFSYALSLIIFACVLSGWILLPKDDSIVAKFGKNQITMSEFKIAYLQLIKSPNVFDSKELRENFLDQLIQWRLLSDEAKKLGFDKNELLQYKINSFRDKCLRDAHFEKVIKPKIQVAEKDVEEAYLYTQEERKISHLFSPRKSMADSLYTMLKKGASFDSLAKICFSDTALSNHGGDLGWINWDQLEYDLAMAAFRQPANEFSPPIRSSYGYHIIKVTDFKKHPMITRQEYELHRRKVKYLLDYKIGDKLAYEYIDKMLKKDNIKIYPGIVSIIEQKLADKFKRKPGQYDQMLEVQLKDDEIKTIETNLWDERKTVLAVINGKNLTIGDFIGYLNFVPYKIFSSGMRATLDCVFRDYLITQEAKKMNLNKSEKVKLRTEVFTQNLLQVEFRKILVQGVTVSEDEVKLYYDEHKSKYKDESFELAHDYIKDFVLNEKRRSVVPDYIKKLEGNIKIEKNLDVIHKYYDAIINKEDL